MVNVSGVPVTSPWPFTEIPCAKPSDDPGVFSTVTEGVQAVAATARAARAMMIGVRFNV
jgi:hypothetical protein